MITAATSKYVSASRPPSEDDRRPEPGRERADRDQRVHRRGEMARALRAPRGGSRARSRRRPASRARARPTPSRRTGAAGPSRAARAGAVSATATTSRRRSIGDRLVVVMVPPGSSTRARVVAGRLDAPRRARRRVDGRVAAHRRLLGREVDRRLDAVELVQLPLDARDARRARHALEVEADLARRLATHGRGHAASYPASSIAARSAASSSSRPLTVTTFVSRSTATSSTPVDLGHLLADRHRAVRAVDRGDAVGDGLAHCSPPERMSERSIPPEGI